MPCADRFQKIFMGTKWFGLPEFDIELISGKQKTEHSKIFNWSVVSTCLFHRQVQNNTTTIISFKSGKRDHAEQINNQNQTNIIKATKRNGETF